MMFPQMLSSQRCPQSETEPCQRTGARTCRGLKAAEWLPWLLEVSCQLSARGWISSRGNAKFHELLIVSSAPFTLEVASVVNYPRILVLENESVVIAVFLSVRQTICIRNLHPKHYGFVFIYFLIFVLSNSSVLCTAFLSIWKNLFKNIIVFR